MHRTECSALAPEAFQTQLAMKVISEFRAARRFGVAAARQSRADEEGARKLAIAIGAPVAIVRRAT